jgi:CheY-like chemotaxis protein
MPEMDGYDATRKIREMEIQRNQSPVPIIALTADVMILNRENCLSVGMNDFIGKPVVLNDLKKILDIWLKNPASS